MRVPRGGTDLYAVLGISSCDGRICASQWNQHVPRCRVEQELDSTMFCFHFFYRNDYHSQRFICCYIYMFYNSFFPQSYILTSNIVSTWVKYKLNPYNSVIIFIVVSVSKYWFVEWWPTWTWVDSVILKDASGLWAPAKAIHLSLSYFPISYGASPTTKNKYVKLGSSSP